MICALRTFYILIVIIRGLVIMLTLYYIHILYQYIYIYILIGIPAAAPAVRAAASRGTRGAGAEPRGICRGTACGTRVVGGAELTGA